MSVMPEEAPKIAWIIHFIIIILFTVAFTLFGLLPMGFIGIVYSIVLWIILYFYIRWIYKKNEKKMTKIS